MEESEWIDAYLDGVLDEEQSARFSEQLRLDSELRKKIGLRQAVIAGIGLAYVKELKSKLVDFDHSLEKKKHLTFSWKLAAVFVFLLVAGSIIYFSSQPGPSDFDIAEPGLPNVMGITDNIELNNAMSIFKAEDYSTAGKIFEVLLQKQSKNDTLLYFSGLCNFRMGISELAIIEWKQVNVKSEFFRKTQYRLAIAYWLQGDKSKAIDLLQSIRNDKSDLLKEETQNALDAIN